MLFLKQLRYKTLRPSSMHRHYTLPPQTTNICPLPLVPRWRVLAENGGITKERLESWEQPITGALGVAYARLVGVCRHILSCAVSGGCLNAAMTMTCKHCKVILSHWSIATYRTVRYFLLPL